MGMLYIWEAPRGRRLPLHGSCGQWVHVACLCLAPTKAYVFVTLQSIAPSLALPKEQ